MGIINLEIFKNFYLGDFSPIKIMGVINLSPESFYQDSFIPKKSMKKTIESFIKNGATILDFGARSSAPWSEKISIEEEKKRITQALKFLPELIQKNIIISIDTQYSEIAEIALKFAKKNNFQMIINDISSFNTDPKMCDVILKYNCPVCLMATKKIPGDAKTIHEIITSLNSTISLLKERGYDTRKVIIDPGIGKWISEKTYEYDLAILDKLEEFRCFKNPILIGLSRKSFLGTILDVKEAKNREIGSLAATSIAVYNGAHIIRTHDVNKKMIQTIKIASAIRRKPIVLTEKNQSCELIPNFSDIDGSYYFLLNSDVTKIGSKIMSQKMIQKNILLKNLTAPQCLILKQEILARGGDVVLPGDVITTEHKKYDQIFDVVLIGTKLQIENLIKKIRGQDLELSKIANLIQNVLNKESSIKEIYLKSHLNKR